MSMLFMDGFDLYANASDLGYNYVVTNANLSTTGGRFGAGTAQGQSGGFGLNNITKLLGSSNSNLWTSVAVYVPASGTNTAVLGWGAGSTNHNGIENLLSYAPSTGVWSFTAGSGTALASVSAPVAAGWHWLDVRTLYSATVGQLELWIDNVQVLNATGVDTVDNTGYTGYTAVGLYGAGAFNFDDLLVYTPGTRLGDSRIETVVPNSDASPNQGTPSTGTNHYAVVNEAQNSTAEYITMPNTSGDKEVFGVGSLASTPTNVWAVQIKTLANKSDAGSFNLEPLVISSATEADAASQALTTGYGLQVGIFPQDPHTSAQWAYANVNAMHVGFKVP